MKSVISGPRGLWGIARGLRKGARLVELTYGPAGGTVVVRKADGRLAVTADGASLARETTSTGPVGLGLSFGRVSSCAAEEGAGDGTSTALILTSAWLEAVLRAAPEGASPRLIGEMAEAVDLVRVRLGEAVRPITRSALARVAETASHGDVDLARTIVEAVETAGEGGTVLLAAGDGVGLVTETRDGLVLDEGFGEFNESGEPERTFEGPLVATVAVPLLSFEDIRPLLETASQWPGRGVVIFAPEVRGAARATLVTNDRKGVVAATAIAHRGTQAELRDWLEDIAALTGSTVVDPSAGMTREKFPGEWLGSARRITVTARTTSLYAYEEEVVYGRLEARARALLHRAEMAAGDFDRDRARERAAALGGGLSVVRIGGVTLSEAQERRARAEDTLHAVRSALTGGVLPGSGAALAWASQGLPDTPGAAAVAAALRAPRGALARRAGVSPATLDAVPLADPWVGWCAGQGRWRALDGEPATVDSAPAVLGALEAAWSVVQTLARTGAVISSPRR